MPIFPRIRLHDPSSEWPPRSHRALSAPAFVGTFLLLNGLMFHRPLFDFVVSHLNVSTPTGLVTAAAAIFASFALPFSLLLVVALVSVRLTKFLFVLFVLGNAAALYFIDAYRVVLDPALMGNVFNTNTREAFELFHPKLILYVLGFGILPALLVAALPVRRTSAKRALSLAAVTLASLLALAFATSSTWPWFDEHSKQLGARWLPWAWIGNGYIHLRDTWEAQRSFVALPPAQLPPASPDAAKRVVVLVIGEAARAANIAYYGYARDTNPHTRNSDLVVLGPAKSCSTYTTASLVCMLSPDGEATLKYEPLPTYLSRHGVDVVWRSRNFGEPPMRVNTFEGIDEMRAACAAQGCAISDYDEGLLHGLDARIRASAAPQVLIVLHLGGSHGPQYAAKYPPGSERFSPVCRSVQLTECSPESLVNAYDNTLAYTDYVLARLVEQLKAMPDVASAMLYASDHGESLGEGGLYLHGLPNAIAPAVQRDIPFYVWMSPRFRTEQTIAAPPSPGSAYSHRNVFHSVVGALGVSTPVYEPGFDVFRTMQRR